jgi:mannose-1-phosphate guanylyltransferase/mannose-6-phosphate isomerase
MTDLPLVHPVILCGGSGTRLWPLSRQSYPKQFAQIFSQRSLFQDSALRCHGPAFAAPTIVTGDAFRFIVTEQLAAVEIAPNAIVIEPEGRNTAPAVLAAALILFAEDPDALMLVAPSDHVITDAAAFRAAVRDAMATAQSGTLVTFGIHPTAPETGYGYLELASGSNTTATKPQKLKAFVEKPDAVTAAHMLEDGKHLWNAGIFLMSARAIIGAFRSLAENVFTPVAAAVAGAEPDLGFTRLSPGPWAKAPDISIDYAVMEKATDIAVMPYPGGWSDLGGWNAILQEGGPDGEGNALSGHAMAIDCTNSLLRSESDEVELVGIGLENMIAIAMNDAVLVANRDQAQRVKEAVATLKARGAKQATQHPRDFRPWGWFESLVIGDRFQVKRIVVHPGATLSLQSHVHRAEHWIVVEGTAKVTINDTEQLISENQSVYIPLGAKHRMENPGKVPMVLIEVQTGSYLGEDDITRYEDVYARK